LKHTAPVALERGIMELYTFCLLAGFVGLALMAALGAAHGGSHHGHHDSGDFHLGHSVNHGAGHGAAHHTAGPVAHHGSHHHGAHHNAHRGGHRETGSSRDAWLNPLLSFFSPRSLFSILLGLGATGILLRGNLREPLLLVAAVGGGFAFELIVMRPLWNFLLRFASNPARSLESAVLEEGTALTRFDGRGQGLVSIDFDGRVIQMLGTLDAQSQAEKTRVLAGDLLFIEAVDEARNTCTVSPISSREVLRDEPN